MAEFDTLPKPVREMMAAAPFNYATHPANLIVSEVGADAALQIAQKNIPLHIKQAATKDYGPDHPQAKS